MGACLAQAGGMSDDTPGCERPRETARAEAERRAREEREAAALRANLLRRKAQAAERAPDAEG